MEHLRRLWQLWTRVQFAPVRVYHVTRGYLRGVARNRFLQAHRHERRRTRVDLDGIDDAWSRFERDDEGASYLSALEQCLQLLPPRNQEVLRMRYHLRAGI